MSCSLLVTARKSQTDLDSLSSSLPHLVSLGRGTFFAKLEELPPFASELSTSSSAWLFPPRHGPVHAGHPAQYILPGDLLEPLKGLRHLPRVPVRPLGYRRQRLGSLLLLLVHRCRPSPSMMGFGDNRRTIPLLPVPAVLSQDLLSRNSQVPRHRCRTPPDWAAGQLSAATRTARKGPGSSSDHRKCGASWRVPSIRWNLERNSYLGLGQWNYAMRVERDNGSAAA